MARILFFSNPVRGVLNPIIAYANYLQEAGHQVTLAAPESVKELVVSRGIPYEPTIDSLNSPYQGTWFRKKAPKGMSRVEHAAAQLRKEEFDQMMARIQPDLLLVDVERYPYTIWAHSHGVPVGLLSVWFTIFKRPGLPPLHRYIVPGKGFKGSWLGIQRSWWRHQAKKLFRYYKYYFRDSGADRIRVARQLAKESGFPFSKEVHISEWLNPFSFRTIPMLSMVCEEMEFPHSVKANQHYIGPMIQLDRSEVEFTNDETDARLADIFARQSQDPEKHKVIYCGSSSIISTDVSLLKKIIEVAQRHPDWQFILGLGRRLTVDKLGSIPSNVHPFKWVPQLRVLENSDCCFTHAGINTINECIHFKVPMIVYSGGVNDEHGCAARMFYHYHGIIGDLERDDTDQVEQHVITALTDATLHQNMDKLYESYMAKRGKGLEIVEELMGKREGFARVSG